jgi:hypothetical protein
MLKVHILHESRYNRNGEAFRFPLWFHRRRLRSCGIDVRFTTLITPELYDCDVLCISSKRFSFWWSERGVDSVCAFLEDARSRVRRVAWFDISDSTGTTHFRVLPHVDVYVKNQLLLDRSRYREQWYGSRCATDVIHRLFGIEDDNSGAAHLNHQPSDTDLAKVRVGWNSGLAHYGLQSLHLGRVWQRIPGAPRWYPRTWGVPGVARDKLLSCRIGSTYTRKTVSFPRERLRDLLAQYASSEKVSRRQYFSEMAHAYLVCSPFGLGEITLRDFEATVCGAAVMKQSMEHIDTWPHLWEEGTYLPFTWDLSTVNAQLAWADQHRNNLVDFARRAQERYQWAVATEEGYAEFCARFISLVVDPQSPAHRDQQKEIVQSPHSV